jgi:hypothetical protein
LLCHLLVVFMTTPIGTVVDQVEGVVESPNERGIKVAGEWRNVSRFHPIDLPERGARVRLGLDRQGFIRTLQVLDAAPSSTSISSVAPTTRDRTITRLAVLKAASNFLGLMGQSREEVRSDHVLLLADKWLAWVEQANEEQEGAEF